MWDLRWVLLGLGALVLVGVYLWSSGIVSRDMLPALPRRKQRTEPSIGERACHAPTALAAETPPLRRNASSEEERAGPAPDRIVTLRLDSSRRESCRAERAVTALRNAGLEHGRYGIFHRQSEPTAKAFSVASLTEPGSFDLEQPRRTARSQA